jgi:hypothetical protein
MAYVNVKYSNTTLPKCKLRIGNWFHGNHGGEEGVRWLRGRPYHACQVSRVCGVVNCFFPAILFKSQGRVEFVEPK